MFTHDELQEQLKDLKDQIVKEVSQKIKKEKNTVQKTHYKSNEACEYLSCSINTLTKFCIEYKIYPKKRLGVFYYKIEDLDKIFND